MLIGDVCYNFETFGKCPRGLTCRFGAGHISEGRNVTRCTETTELQTKNQLKHEVQITLRKRTYNFDVAEALIKYNDKSEKKVCAFLDEILNHVKHLINFTCFLLRLFQINAMQLYCIVDHLELTACFRKRLVVP